IERSVQFIKGGFAFRAGRELGFTPPVWERGFSEVRIYGSEALARVWEYIAQNPVKRRLVQRPAEYAYSSSNARFELDEVPQGLKPTGSASRRHVRRRALIRTRPCKRLRGTRYLRHKWKRS